MRLEPAGGATAVLSLLLALAPLVGGAERRRPDDRVARYSRSLLETTTDEVRSVSMASNRQQQQPQVAPTTPTPLARSASAIKNVTAQNGQSVLLHCLVEPSGGADVAVSWFRGTGELQLLTYESTTIIQDERFAVRRGLLHADDWALQIKSLDKATDSGLYQCQTSSDPAQSQYYQLNVLEPQVSIQGAPDMAIKLGAPLNLTCVIAQSPDELQFIFWYRDQRMINYDLGASQRGRIVVTKLPSRPDTILSNLQIHSARASDSGNYTCMPSGARPTSIHVHVLEGSDKRLTMFQNDNFHDPAWSAASFQRTNSALSVHVVRLSRGRVYALLVAFLIFSSWYQLVAQLQTAISLLLLAIIGAFLGKLTGRQHQRAAHRLAPPDCKAVQALQLRSESPASPQQPRRPRPRPPRLRPPAQPQEEDERSASQEEPDELLMSRRAHHQAAPPSTPAKPLQSPSASSASTGYNSDTRSTQLTPRAPADPSSRSPSEAARPSRSRADEHEHDDHDMIELVSQPTALHLLMGRLSSPDGSAGSSAGSLSRQDENHYAAPQH